MNTKLTAAALALTGITLTVVVLAALSASTTVPLNGTINTSANIEAYIDSGCTDPVTAIDMQNVNPGSTVSETIYIKNTGNIPLTLTMTASDWSPTGANTYLTLSWNREDYDLNAGGSVSATFTLTVASDTGSLTTFGCSITITGNE